MNKIIIGIIILTNYFIFFHCKNIVLPFNKITIENFSGQKSIEDLISFNIFTNISIGTPPQIVAHFIDQTDYYFRFQKRLITYGNNKFSKFLKQYESLSNFWFEENKSSTFKRNDSTGFCSDIYYFNNINNEKIKTKNIKYNILETHITDKYKCGIIGINNPNNLDFKLNKKEIYFLN